MYTTHGHIIIAMTAGHRAPCLHPTPNADSPHRATERATGDAEQTGKADTHGGTQGQPGAPGAAGADAGQIVGGDAGQIGQAKTGRATRRPSEPRRAAQDAAEGKATTADAEQAQRGTERRQRGFSCAV